MKSILQVIFTIIQITCINAYGYTFNEDILEKCGLKHPNDFIGRIVCNNNLGILACIAKEEKKVNTKIDEIHESLNRNADLSLAELREKINLIKDVNGGYLKSELVSENKSDVLDKRANTNVLITSVHSNCTSDKYYLVNVREDNEKKINSMRVWFQGKNEEDDNNFSIRKYDWLRTLNENEIQKYRDIKSCLKESEIDFAKNKNTIEEITKNKDDLLFEKYIKSFEINQSKYSYEVLNNKYEETKIKRKIKIYPKCIASDKSLFQELEIITNEKNIEYIEIKEIKNLIETKYLYIWKSKNLKELEEKANKENTASTKSENTVSNTTISKNQGVYAYSFALVVLILFLIFFLLVYFHKKIQEKVILIINRVIGKEKYNFNQQEEIKIQNVNIDESNILKRMESDSEFKERNNFIEIEIPINLREMFIEECNWFKQKKGNYPIKDEQIAILKSLTR